jgi:type II secretory pathway component PulJ
MRLEVSGALDLTARAELAQRLAGLEAAMFWLETDLSRLHVRPTAEDLEKIDFQGVLREAAEQLRAEAADEALSPALRRRAEDALVQLFVMSRDAKGQAA